MSISVVKADESMSSSDVNADESMSIPVVNVIRRNSVSDRSIIYNVVDEFFNNAIDLRWRSRNLLKGEAFSERYQELIIQMNLVCEKMKWYQFEILRKDPTQTFEVIHELPQPSENWETQTLNNFVMHSNLDIHKHGGFYFSEIVKTYNSAIETIRKIKKSITINTEIT